MQENRVDFLDIINDRLDPHYYRKEFIKLINSFDISITYKLGDVVEFSFETWDQKSNFEDKFPYIEISEIDITTGKIQNINWCPIEKAPSRAKMVLKTNDIIISTTRPHRGAISIIPSEYSGYIASTGFSIIRQIKMKDLSKDYLYIFLKTSLSLKQMLQRASGGNYPAINQDELKKILIPIPDKNIQEKIVKIMSEAYAKRKKCEDKAQELINSVNDLLLNELNIEIPNINQNKEYKIHFSDIFNSRFDINYNHPTYKNIENILSKAKFELLPLYFIADFVPGYAFSSDIYMQHKTDTKLLTIKNIKKNLIDFSDVTYLPDDNFYEYKKFKLLKNDIVIAMTGATIGKSSVFDLDEQVLLNQRVGIIRARNGNNPIFINAYINSDIFQNEIIRNSCGGAQPNISEKEIMAIKIPIPDINTQNKIANEITNKLNKVKYSNQQAQEEFEKTKERVERIILGEEKI